MPFEVDIRRQPLADNQIVVSTIVDGDCKEQWIVLDGPHLQTSCGSHGEYVYAKVASTGRTERLYLSDAEADQIRAIQAG